jgi:hypothetical protein
VDVEVDARDGDDAAGKLLAQALRFDLVAALRFRDIDPKRPEICISDDRHFPSSSDSSNQTCVL